VITTGNIEHEQMTDKNSDRDKMLTGWSGAEYEIQYAIKFSLGYNLYRAKILKAERKKAPPEI
jgi:hypothetical protein